MFNVPYVDEALFQYLTCLPVVEAFERRSVVQDMTQEAFVAVEDVPRRGASVADLEEGVELC